MKNKVIKAILYWGLKLIYRVKIVGLENYPDKSTRFLIISNHISFLDGLLLATFLPDHVSFVVHTYYSDNKWLKFFFNFVDIYAVDQNNPFILKDLVKATKEGMHCVIFPEGKISTTGTLMKIYEGPGLIADRADAGLLPVYIQGPQYTPFTRLIYKSYQQFFPKITITIAPLQKIKCPDDIRGRTRRKIIGIQVSDIMANLALATSPYKKTLFTSLIEAQKHLGARREILEDMERKALSYRDLTLRSFVLGRYMAKYSRPNDYVGILLPTSNAAVVTLFGLHAYGRIPAFLNFTTSAPTLLASCIGANIRRIYTSRQFIEKAKLEKLIEVLSKDIEIIYLEDCRSQIKLVDKLLGKIHATFPRYFYNKFSKHVSYTDPAVLLFTSGSEALPKAVLLSHENVQANRYQLNTRFDFHKDDVALTSLPLFHSFGFMGITMQIFTGTYVFCYPSPLHYRVIPELCYDINATFVYGTDTFLAGYGKCANPYDFYRVRYVLSGGEAVKKETRELWFEKFGIRITEGYGITETSPVIACNSPKYYKTGTVGRFVPGVEHKLEPIPEINDPNTGKLWVKGPNIFKGYLVLDKSNTINSPTDGWYSTGDIVSIDMFGFITILGRAKRFAKISGEMVSLSAVELHISALRSKYGHAVINLPDTRKGEMLVLITESEDLNREHIIDYYQSHQISMLMLPKKIIFMKELPRTAAGKINYLEIQNLTVK